MQEGQRIIGDSHPHVVILFSDIVGFSTLATDLPAIEVFMLVGALALCCLVGWLVEDLPASGQHQTMLSEYLQARVASSAVSHSFVG